MSFEQEFINNDFGNSNSPGGQKTRSLGKYTYMGVVTENIDPLDLGRVKVLVNNLDNVGIWAFPKLPKYLHMIPQIDEAVLVEIPSPNAPNKERYYSSSIISSLSNIKKDIWFKKVGSILGETIAPPSTNLNVQPEAKGVFPDVTDIAIIGRDNTDIIQKKEQIILRCGKHLSNEVLKANRKNPASVGLIFHKEISYVVNQADKVFLLSHNGSNRIPKYIEKETVETLTESTQPTLYGNNTIEFLKLLKDALIQHYHPFNGDSPEISYDAMDKLSKFKIETILNENVRMN